MVDRGCSCSSTDIWVHDSAAKGEEAWVEQREDHDRVVVAVVEADRKVLEARC